MKVSNQNLIGEIWFSYKEDFPMEVFDLSFKKTLKASKVSDHSEEMENSWPNYYDCRLKNQC